MVISYFVFAWPVGIPLMFATSLELYGLWWGFVLGAGVKTVSFCAFIACIDWNKEASKVSVTFERRVIRFIVRLLPFFTGIMQNNKK